MFYSVIVPVYNSRRTLGTLVERVSAIMENERKKFELILVDDGSSDGSYEEIRRLRTMSPYIRGFKLSRNFGHQAALSIGMRESRGDIVAIIDDDLQDPPEILVEFFDRLLIDADVVYGVRRKRKEGKLKSILFNAFYRVLSVLSNVEIPNDAGDFCAMRRCVVDAMLHMYDANPFWRGVRSWVGFRQVGLEYERAARIHGESGYTFRKYFKLAATGIMMFSNFPLRLSMYMGLVASGGALIFMFIALITWFFDVFYVPGYMSLVVLITFLGGAQLLSVGIIGEYIVRLLDNTRRWPLAFVAEKTEE